MPFESAQERELGGLQGVAGQEHDDFCVSVNAHRSLKRTNREVNKRLLLPMLVLELKRKSCTNSIRFKNTKNMNTRKKGALLDDSLYQRTMQ
jgi:hypothetical protein